MKNRIALTTLTVVVLMMSILTFTGCLFAPSRVVSEDVATIATEMESTSSLEGGQEADQEAINAKIIPMLREIVEARKKMIRLAEEKVLMGRVSQKDLLDAKINLLEVNIRLARAQGERDAVIEGLQSIVNSHRAHMKELLKMVTVGAAPPEALDEAEVGFFEARIRLLRERDKGAKTQGGK